MKIRLEVTAGSRLRLAGAPDRAWVQFATDGEYEIEVNIEDVAAELLDERYQDGYSTGYDDAVMDGD